MAIAATGKLTTVGGVEVDLPKKPQQIKPKTSKDVVGAIGELGEVL